VVKIYRFRSFLPVFALAVALPLFMPAAGLAGAGRDHGDPGGSSGAASEVDRTVRIEAKDMQFHPDTVDVANGETVRFVIRNADTVEHEFTIGPPEVQAAHRQEMAAMYDSGAMDPAFMSEGDDSHPGMMGSHHAQRRQAASAHGHDTAHGGPAMIHDDPNAVFLQPGETRELIWRFDRAQELKFACNVPGHFEAGMTGQFRFEQP
jgi:uncharacterized cupredoxin-like copper-binding protein